MATVVVGIALIVVTVTYGRLLASERRERARERALILNQLLHATGKTWTPPPAEALPIVYPADPAPVTWTATPERFPT